MQDFNITKVNRSHVCMEYSSLKGTAFQYTYHVKLDNTDGKHDPYTYKLNITSGGEANISTCLSPSVPNGHYRFCVSAEHNNYCVFNSSKNVTNGIKRIVSIIIIIVHLCCS